MATRMQRYRQSDSGNSRSQRNKELYKDIYEYGEYSNIEGIASLGKTNEIDITKVKEMLNNRESYQKRREYQKVVRPTEREMPLYEEVKEEPEEKNYDIRDILVKARENMPRDDKERVLCDSKYEFLEKLKAVKKDEEANDGELKDLINTITSTSMLNKLSDATLAGEFFGDLVEGNDEDTKSIKEYIDETKKEDLPQEDTLDKSFFTSSLNLDKVNLFESENEEKKVSVFSIIIIVILVIIILACVGVLVYKRFM